jgi:chromosomal replication initiator protein
VLFLGLAVENIFSVLDHVNVWQNLLDVLEKESDNPVDFAFLEAFQFAGIEGSFVKLIAPDHFRQNWLESHYKALVETTLRKIDPAIEGYKVSIANVDRKIEIPQLNLQAVPLPKKPKVSHTKKELPSLYCHYSFDNFIQGHCNEVALKTSMAIAQNPGEKSMNPLYLYGSTGLGKTHLMQSMARYLLAHRTSDHIVYRNAEQFLNDAVARYKGSFEEKKKAIAHYSETYEKADILLLDDIHILEKKEHTQELLLHLLDSFRLHHKQVILCSDRKPAEFSQMSEKLISRFEEGLTVSIDALDYSTRLEILKNKASDLSFPKEEEESIFRCIASLPISNVRELEGFISKMRANQELMKKTLSLDFIQSLAHISANIESPSLTPQHIIETTASTFGVDSSLLSSKKQNQSLSLPRKMAMYLCREYTSETLQNIGSLFNRDYATVIASIKSIKKELGTNNSLSQKANEIKEALRIS